MAAAKMTVAFLEAHRGFQQDQDREEATSGFVGLTDWGTKGVQSALTRYFAITCTVKLYR
jgi:hypothetical protein